MLKIAGTRAGLGALALVLSLAPLSAARADTNEFKKAFASTKNSWEKANAIKTLDPNDKKAYKLLTKLLSSTDWYLRSACIDVLSGAFEKETTERMVKDMNKGKARVAEGIVLAFGKASDTSKVKYLIEALESKHWQVRRAAALALKNVPSKEAVGPLIDAWEQELKKGKEFRVWTRYVEALEEITGEDELEGLADWKNWWIAVKDNWDPSKKKKKEEGKTSTVAGVRLGYRSRGSGGALLVIPDYGFEKDYMETYMRVFEKSNKVIYVSLPKASDFNPPVPNAPNRNAPIYPLEQLVKAFDELVTKIQEEDAKKEASGEGGRSGSSTKDDEKKRGGEKDGRINILAHGMNCWIGMKYAELKPNRVRRLILVAPFSSGDAWSKGNQRHIDNGKKTGDQEEQHFAEARIEQQNGKTIYEAKSEDDGDALQRKKVTKYFADVTDLEIGVLMGKKVVKELAPGQGVRTYELFRPMGKIYIPMEFKVEKLNKAAISRVPTVIIAGKYGLMTSLDDCKRIQKHWGTAKLIPFGRSARMPFIEENEKFVKILDKFVN